MGEEKDSEQQSKWFERVRERGSLPDKPVPPARPGRKKRLALCLAVLVLAGALAAFLILREPSKNTASSPPPPAMIQQPPPAPPPPTTPQRDKELEALFSSWAQSHGSNDWSMVVYGLDGDSRFAEFEPDEVYASASIYKLLLMYPLFQEVSLDEAESVSISVSGSSRNLLSCVSAMLKVSDNPCGRAVGDMVGWAHADEELKKIGLSDTLLNSSSGSLTTAGDTAVFLKALYNDRLFDQTTKKYIVDTLYEQTWRDGIVAGCKGCTVANKTGDLGVRHDAGIIEYPGGAYILVIFTDGASYAQIAQLTSQVHQHMSSAN